MKGSENIRKPVTVNIYFEILSVINPVKLSTYNLRPKRFEKKTMLYVGWDQKAVIDYELLNSDRYQQQMID